MLIEDAWFTVQHIDDRTYAISEYGHWEKVHSFLLLGTKKAALIDTGLGIDSIKRITDQLTKLPIDVITTHVHSDHIGGHGEFNALYVHEAEEDWLINGIKGLSIDMIRKNVGRDITIPTPASFNPVTFTPFQGKPTGLLRDGDEIQLGERKLLVLHTPGHSPGHICLFDEQAGYLFTGDLLYDVTPVYAFYPTTNPADLIASWQRIAGLRGVRKIYGSHNTLGLDPLLLKEVKSAARYLRANNLAKFGTGIHQFNGFSVQF